LTIAEFHMARREDARQIAKNLRAADLAEMRAVLGDVEDPADSLIYGVDNSEYPLVARIDGEPVALMGVIRDPLNCRVGCVWLMGTDKIVEYKKTFLEHSIPCLNTLFDSFQLLWCCMDKRNTVHARWVKWMGFTLIREVPSFGEQRRPFLEFAKMNTHV